MNLLRMRMMRMKMTGMNTILMTSAFLLPTIPATPGLPQPEE
jgi:hypothetical protein